MSLFGVLKQADPALVTISTIGYGQMSPATLYGNIVMTVEGRLPADAGSLQAAWSWPKQTT